MSTAPPFTVRPRASVRSRFFAAIATFVVGFGVANLGVLAVSGDDRWLWLLAAVVLMGTGVAGVVLADTRRDVSGWAVLGVELLVLFTVVPLLWVISVATSPAGEPRRSLWPSDVSLAAFTDVWTGAGDVPSLGGSFGVTVIVAGVATLLSMAVALPAAHALVRRPPARAALVHRVFVAALLVPYVALAGAVDAQLLDLGLSGNPWLTALFSIAVALPLAVVLAVRMLRRVPWSLGDAIRADGGTRLHQLRHFVLPHLGADLAVVSTLVFFWTAGDFAIGAAAASPEGSRTLPAALLELGSAGGDADRIVAAAGLWWLLPLIVVGAVFSRRLVTLLGRS